MAVDYEAEGLLEGLEDDEARAARLELLKELHDDGVALEELKRAVAEDRLVLLPVERAIGGECSYTQREVADKTGVPMEVIQEQRRVVGLPRVETDEKVYTERDVDAIAKLKEFLDAGLPYDRLSEVSRVTGEAMARVADTAARAVGDAFIREGDTERELGQRYAEVARQLVPMMGEQLEYVFGLHLTEQIRSAYIAQAELAAAELKHAAEVTVCFADLVGFTKLGERVAPEEVGTVARRLGEIAGDVVEPPTRLIKTIGDAAMLVSPEPEPAVRTALALVDVVDNQGDDFPTVHAGLALGPAMRRAGDWYGRPVNLASRVTDIARPGAVLATGEVRDAVGDGYSWSAAGRRRVKGVKEPVSLFRVRPPRD